MTWLFDLPMKASYEDTYVAEVSGLPEVRFREPAVQEERGMVMTRKEMHAAIDKIEQNEIDAIARVIDPVAFGHCPDDNDLSDQDRARAKARFIKNMLE